MSVSSGRGACWAPKGNPRGVSALARPTPPPIGGWRLARKSRVDLETELLAILKERTGPEQAITAGALSQISGASPRVIRKIISRLVTETKIPIASSVHWPYGFYLITSAEQAEATLRQYWSRVREVAKRARALGQVVEQRFGVRYQKEFPFDEDPRQS